MRGLLCMQKVNSSFILKVLPRACLIFLVCLSLVAFSSYTAPKASAEALTLTLTTAFLMLTIAVMATLGVTLTASTNQDAIDYINDPFISFLQGKGYNSIADYLASAGITSITQLCIPVFGAVNIVKSVYDIIAEFCSTFFSDNNVVSGGSEVGNLPSDNTLTMGFVNPNYIGGTSVVSVLSATTFKLTFDNWRLLNSSQRPCMYLYIPLSNALSSGINSFTLTRENIDATANQTIEFGYLGTNGIRYFGTSLSFNNNVATFNINSSTTANSIGATTLILYFYPSYYRSVTGSVSYTLAQSSLPVASDFFVISPSATVLSPPQVATGQSYSVPASGVTSTDSVDEAITASVLPLTTTEGLSTTGTVSGTAVPAESEWLYEDTQAIRNNTNPHFDFIPSTLGFDFSIWHYVVDMMNSVSSAFALLGTFINNMPAAVLVFPFGVFALAITVALLRRFLS